MWYKECNIQLRDVSNFNEAGFWVSVAPVTAQAM
jgi:hypothetical protein